MTDLNIKDIDPEILGIINFYRTKHGLPNQTKAVEELVRMGFDPKKECSWMANKTEKEWIEV